VAVVFEELREEDEEPNGVADVSAYICENAEGFW
jgi:hypothetical protein